MKKILVLLFTALSSFIGHAQVSIAPTAVFFDKNGTGTLYITNSSEVPQEINISFEFGYPSQSESGNLTMVYKDTLRANVWGLDKMVKAFPRSFILPPKQQQLVRFQVRAPKELPDGTYFTRVKVSTSAQVTDIGGSDQDGGISTRVNVRFEQVIAALYRKGSTTTGLRINTLEVLTDSNFVSIKTNYKTTGNSPFLGRVKVVVKSKDGNVVVDGAQTVALYFDGFRTINLNAGEALKPGQYDVELLFETVRSDISTEDMVMSSPYTYKGSFVVK